MKNIFILFTIMCIFVVSGCVDSTTSIDVDPEDVNLEIVEVEEPEEKPKRKIVYYQSFINSSEGEQKIGEVRDYYKGHDEVEIPKLLNRYINEQDDSFYIFGNRSINIFNKESQELSSYSINDQIEAHWDAKRIKGTIEDQLTFLYLEILEINERFNLILVKDENTYSITFPFLFDKEIQKLDYLDAESFYRGGSFISGPIIESQIDDSAYLLKYQGGDACWNRGYLYKFSLEEAKATKLLDFGRGCADNEYSYLATKDKNLLIANREKDDNTDSFEKYSSLKQMNLLTGEIENIIAEEDFPEGVIFAGYDRISNKIILRKQETYTSYDLETKEYSEPEIYEHENFQFYKESSFKGMQYTDFTKKYPDLFEIKEIEEEV